MAQKHIPATITIYDVSKFMFVSKELAERYVINTENVLDMCRKNRQIALTLGDRDDVAQAWSMAEMIATGLHEMESSDDDMFAGQNPFSKNLLESLIFHFATKVHDIQTAAMLCCAFGRHCPPPDQLYRTSSSGSKSVSQSVSN